MPNHLSILGIIHTAISILAILAAIATLFSYGKITPTTGPGKLYILLTIITCVTGLPIMKTGHPTGGHYLGILILILLPIGIYAKPLRIFGKLADYAQVIILSATLFFSFVPAIIETLTRLPISHPLADSPNSPIVQTGLLILVFLFITGVLYQVFKLKSTKK
ncbi:MAG: hypothetical protein ACXVAY_00100 [Mucilaginibacter sp.]